MKSQPWQSSFIFIKVSEIVLHWDWSSVQSVTEADTRQDQGIDQPDTWTQTMLAKWAPPLLYMANDMRLSVEPQSQSHECLLNLCFCLQRGFVWATYEGRPFHYKRSRVVNAGRDAHITAELWVETLLFPIDSNLNCYKAGFSVCNTPLFAFHRNIFLGETFSSYISVHNDSSQVVKDILVKVWHRQNNRLTNIALSRSCWRLILSRFVTRLSSGWSTDELAEAQSFCIKLRSGRAQVRVLHRWCYPPRSQRNRNAHVSVFFWLKQSLTLFWHSNVRAVSKMSSRLRRKIRKSWFSGQTFLIQFLFPLSTSPD